MSVKSELHHHTCFESEDHHCPECCSCECCAEHRRFHKHSPRQYEAHRRYRSIDPVKAPRVHPIDPSYAKQPR